MNEPLNNAGDIIIYQTEDGLTKIDVKMEDETVWLSLDQMAELFQLNKFTISRQKIQANILFCIKPNL